LIAGATFSVWNFSDLVDLPLGAIYTNPMHRPGRSFATARSKNPEGRMALSTNLKTRSTKGQGVRRRRRPLAPCVFRDRYFDG
jgi:hypothetical protein